MIRTLEELAMNAWPALQTMLYDGWVLRFASGYTRRSNSISPIYHSTLPLDEKIPACERIYREKGLKVVYKITSDPALQDLDAYLERQGYQFDAHTSLQVLDLRSYQPVLTPVVSQSETRSEEWITAFMRMSQIDGQNGVTLRQLLDTTLPAQCYASVKVGEEIVACGLGVAQHGFIGFFDIVTDARYRRQGHGQQIMQSLLAWGARRGAHTAYLQVMRNNPPALSLYAKLGFAEAYHYWYRAKA